MTAHGLVLFALIATLLGVTLWALIRLFGSGGKR